MKITFPFLLFILPLLLSANSEPASEEGRKGRMFPFLSSENRQQVVYNNGDSDYYLGFEFVISPQGTKVATIYDDFVVKNEKMITFDMFQTLVTVGTSMCQLFTPAFEIFSDSPRGSEVIFDGPFTVNTSLYTQKVDKRLGAIHYLSIHFPRHTLESGHYWIKLSCLCAEPQNIAFALSTTFVKYEEAWIKSPEHFGRISESPLDVPPQDFAFALALSPSTLPPKTNS